MKKITKLELLKKIKIILQSDKKISFDTKLKDIEEWDSVATISMIALFDELFDFIIPADLLLKCKTIDDLIKLAPDKLDI
jgi:acyl carrier protein|tara:strand:- start:87 stop:326 length:240 start_codon:yes stop_codon:yes gene_type:complete